MSCLTAGGQVKVSADVKDDCFLLGHQLQLWWILTQSSVEAWKIPTKPLTCIHWYICVVLLVWTMAAHHEIDCKGCWYSQAVFDWLTSRGCQSICWFCHFSMLTLSLKHSTIAPLLSSLRKFNFNLKINQEEFQSLKHLMRSLSSKSESLKLNHFNRVMHNKQLCDFVRIVILLHAVMTLDWNI